MPEVVQCPKCDRNLKVPDTLLGEPVQCPRCQSIFKAELAPARGGPEEPAERPEEQYEEATTRRPGGSALRSEREEQDEPDEDEGDDRERRRSRRRRMRVKFMGEPDRGVLILVLGILSLIFFFCPLMGWVFGGCAWTMANEDLDKMSMGTMDDQRKGLTRAGQICGVIGVVFSTLSCCGILASTMTGIG